MRRTASLLGSAVGTLAALTLALAPTAAAETAPNGYPYCANGSASDPDGDGWGWENNRSCVVRTGSGSGSGSGSSACPSGATCGSYTVGGLGSRKQQVRNAGGSSLDLAVAMLETERMDTAYPYGDNKSGDAANFGIFKQNWLMLRSACAQFGGQGAGQYDNGAALNSSLGQDVSCLHQSQSHYGLDAWFAGHRNGASGLSSPNTADIAAYKAAVYWIKAQLDADSANLGNDTRFWVQVPAI
ncbi:carbohydrate-binding domain-containing protein [Streptomyces sp. NRRL B-24484]|nr:carbohydrate-binding domain-containing protein [Streptomyces sp. NRRL B-24484]